METTIQYHPGLIRALPIISTATHGRMRIEHLTGPSNAAHRVAILAALRGVPKLPKAAAGINALLAELYAVTGVQGSCMAVREDNLAEYCRQAAASAL